MAIAADTEPGSPAGRREPNGHQGETMSIAVAAVSGQPGLYTPSMRRRVIAGTTIGNALEFFDFTVFTFLMLVIGPLFFPAASGYGQLLLTTATFGVGFLMRPVGGMLIGSYADRHGRRAAMTLTLWLMGLGCGLIALAPTYAQMGIAGPVIMVLARLIQGFAAGGEVGASTTLLVEHAPPSRRGFQLAIRQPVAGRDAGRAGGGAADRRAHARADEGLGLARALRDRHPDRAGGRLYPPQPGRDAGAPARARRGARPPITSRCGGCWPGTRARWPRASCWSSAAWSAPRSLASICRPTPTRNWACRPRPRCRPAWCWAPSVSWPRPSSACWPTAWDASA